MKRTLILTLAAFTLHPFAASVQAAPLGSKHRQAQICAMCRNKNTRLMMIRELMNSPEGKREMAEMLMHDAEFRSYYEAHTVNPG